MRLVAGLLLWRVAQVRAVAQETLAKIDALYGANDFKGAEQAYLSEGAALRDDVGYQKKYLSFLLKTGQYAKILAMPAIASANEHFRDTAKSAHEALASRDAQRIAPLVRDSPLCLPVLAAAARVALHNGDGTAFLRHASQALSLNKTSPEILSLYGAFYAAHGDYPRADSSLRSAGNAALADTLAGFLKHLDALTASVESPASRLGAFKTLYASVSKARKSLDESGPRRGIPELPHFYRGLLEKILALAVRHCLAHRLTGESLLAGELYAAAPTKENIWLVFQSHCLNGAFTRAEELFARHKAAFSAADRTNFERHLAEARRAHAERLQQEQQRRQQQEQRQQQERQRRQQEQRQQQERQRQQSYQAAHADAPDYYKILGIEKTADTAAIKKAYRKKHREFQKRTRGKPTKAQTEELQLLNKALSTLSRPEQRTAYDAQRDSPFSFQQPGGHGGNSFVFEDDFENIFGSFLGGGRQRQKQQRYYYYTF